MLPENLLINVISRTKFVIVVPVYTLSRVFKQPVKLRLEVLDFFLNLIKFTQIGVKLKERIELHAGL
jgi:hypothetical protein